MTTDLNIYEHTSLTEKWLNFIVACPNGGTPYQYNVIISGMANDQIYNYVAGYSNGTITREQFWTLAKFKYPTHQIFFCSEKALACLKYRESHKIVDYEWRELKKDNDLFFVCSLIEYIGRVTKNH